MITSVSLADDVEVIDSLIRLHAPLQPGATAHEVLDSTYGHGGFWRTSLIAPVAVTGIDIRPELTHDDVSRPPTVIALTTADFTQPFARPSSFDVVTFDPPFITAAQGSLLATRYSAYRNYTELLTACHLAGAQFARILRPNGVAIAKAMDWTEGRRRHWFHDDLTTAWTDWFRLDDMLIKVNTSNIRSSTWHTQQRTKATHTFFLVFRLLRRRTSPYKPPTPEQGPRDIFGNPQPTTGPRRAPTAPHRGPARYR